MQRKSIKPRRVTTPAWHTFVLTFAALLIVSSLAQALADRWRLEHEHAGDRADDDDVPKETGAPKNGGAPPRG